jgi:glutamate-ammonia-ligase adenylyltransferase
MRKLMLKEHGQAGVWDIKHTRGGLVDVEFIAQALQLLGAASHPEVLNPNTHRALLRLEAEGLLAPVDGEVLRHAASLYSRLTQVLRLCVSETYEPRKAPAGLNRIIAAAAGCADIAQTEALLADTQDKVADLFDRLIGVPA